MKNTVDTRHRLRRAAMPLLALGLLLALVVAAAIPAAAVTTPAWIQTKAATSVSDSQATINGWLRAINATYAHVGFIWGTAANLAGGTNTTVANRTVAGNYSWRLTNLKVDTTYYFRAWALNSGGYWTTGAILSFKTTNLSGAVASSVTLLSSLLTALIPLIVILAIFSLIFELLIGRGGQGGIFGGLRGGGGDGE